MTAPPEVDDADILEVIATAGEEGLTTREVAQAVGVTNIGYEQMVWRSLNRLAQRGLVERAGQPHHRFQSWRLTGPAGPVQHRERGRLVRRADARTGVPYVKTSVKVLGQAQIEVFEALCRLHGRAPHEVAADLVLSAIRAARDTHEIQDLLAQMRMGAQG